MNGIQDIMSRIASATTYKPLGPREYEQFRVDGLNDAQGDRNAEDGYDCRLCKNRALIAKLVERPDGTFTHCFVPCKCEEIRRSIMRMKRSGLKDIIKDYTFDKFEATEPWQIAVKDEALAYAKNPDGWFFLGGQSGSGKTHICTAICREFLLAGKQVVYMLWRDDIVKLKGVVNDSEAYAPLIDRFKKADVLYIDDLFKTGKAADMAMQKPTPADINAAFEIVNYRYNNPELLTIISSELSEDELLDIDEAIGGRIFERAKTITIARDRARNYRIRKAVTV